MLEKELITTRIDPRTKRTRQLLLDAFGALLSEKSFEEITVQDITERATVNRATFYAHFDDKYVLLDESMTELVRQRLHDKLPPDSQLNAANLELLIQTVCEFLAHLHSHCPPSNRNQFDSLVEHLVKQQVYLMLLHWLEETNSTRRLNQKQIELQATVTSWSIYGAAKTWSNGDRAESATAFAHRALPMILAGFPLPGGGATKPRTLAA